MSVTLVLAGSIRECVGGVEEVASPLSVVVKPVDTVHSNQFGATGARTIQILLDAHEAACVAQAAPALGTWRWLHAGPAVRQFLALARAFHSDSHLELELLSTEVLASIALEQTTSRSAPSWLKRIREQLDELRSRVDVRELARGADVHPVYLARQFRRHFHCSITEYVHRQRLSRAAQQLSLHGKSISSIAYESGFADHAHMCRAFQRTAGISPSVYRAVATD